LIHIGAGWPGSADSQQDSIGTGAVKYLRNLPTKAENAIGWLAGVPKDAACGCNSYYYRHYDNPVFFNK